MVVGFVGEVPPVLGVYGLYRAGCLSAMGRGRGLGVCLVIGRDKPPGQTHPVYPVNVRDSGTG